jgi:hypothetical protein
VEVESYCPFCSISSSSGPLNHVARPELAEGTSRTGW